MSKLHELLPAESALQSQMQKIEIESKGVFNKNELFLGLVKVTTMLDENRSNEDLTENKQVTTTVPDRLAYTKDYIVRCYDAFLQKEEANQRAKADIVLEDGTVLAKDVPACALLGFESKLAQFRQMLESVPTLQPGIAWEESDTPNVYKDKHGITKMKTEKTKKFVTVAPATDKHPAQVEKWDADVPVAKINEHSFSGMVTSAYKKNLLGKCDALIIAVKSARQRANDVEVSNITIGKRMMDFVLG